MTLLVKPHQPDPRGVTIDITPQSAGWHYVGFRILDLKDQQRHAAAEAGRETCLVILSGRAEITAGDTRFAELGARRTVFEGMPTSVYIPAGLPYAIQAKGTCQIAVCSAPAADKGSKPALISPDSVKQEVRGVKTNTRYVRNILSEADTLAQSLLVVEVITPGGHWSSYPPHKHDRDALPAESFLEETYYHRFNPPQGFGFQRVYTDDGSIDETACLSDGCVVMVPRGYHPVTSAHGYDLYYLNVMAGPTRTWLIHNDPAHDWLLKH
jgi:5-deoxy-glucuronate isomerase